jgi:hypothetical protein
MSVVKVPARVKRNDISKLESFFYSNELQKIEDVFGKSYGKFVEAKDGKKYSVSYKSGKGFMDGYLSIKKQ